MCKENEMKHALWHGYAALRLLRCHIGAPKRGFSSTIWSDNARMKKLQAVCSSSVDQQATDGLVKIIDTNPRLPGISTVPSLARYHGYPK